MGGEASKTRRLTLDNDEATSVIKVSQDVVERLKGSEREQAQPPPPVSSIVSPIGPGAPRPAASGFPQPYFYDPSLISLQIRQEKEAALKRNDQYWEKRIADLEKIHGQMHQIMEDEYQKAVKEVKLKKEDADAPKCYAPPCQTRKKAVMDCYKMHPREPMKCSKEVEAFAECVDVQRATLIANRG